MADVPQEQRSVAVRHDSDPAPDEDEQLWGGRIQVRGEVGRGAMGRVLLGYDLKLRREMALKVTNQPRSELPRQLLARFYRRVREASAAAA